jgi:hypothetical protein
MPKTGQPDTSDAQVMIGLYEAQAAQKITEVMGYIWSDDFPTDFKIFRERHERGSNSSEEQSVHRILAYFETIGTLYRNNLISEDLLFDWLAVDMVWGRVKGFVAGLRRESGSARMYENFEYMARRSANWKPARSRPAAARRPAAKRPATKRPAAKRPAAKRPAAKRPAAQRTTAAKRTRPAAVKRAPAAKRTAARGRTTARRATAARKRA